MQYNADLVSLLFPVCQGMNLKYRDLKLSRTITFLVMSM